MRKYHIQPGDKYGRLTCVKLSHIGKHNRSYFLFKCDCGNEKIILGSGVKSGNTKSCGCLSNEVRRRRLPNNRGVIYQIILGYKRHAKNRGYEWGLSIDQVTKIISEKCHYCGADASNRKITKNCPEGFFYNGIDRVDNDKGYFINNVVPACRQCNQSKGQMSKSDFIKWIKAMADQWG